MYSIDENTALSKNFKAKEFVCKDGSFLFPDYRLILLLQNIREHFRKAVVINSAYRSAAYNKKVGGASNSQHLYAKAADIAVSGVTPLAVAKYAETLLNGTGGIGLYASFTHVDVRDSKSRWDSTSGTEKSVTGF